MRSIISRVLAPEIATSWLPVCRRSWKWNPAGRPTLTTVFVHSVCR